MQKINRSNGIHYLWRHLLAKHTEKNEGSKQQKQEKSHSCCSRFPAPISQLHRGQPNLVWYIRLTGF